jgi:hypothetical protein
VTGSSRKIHNKELHNLYSSLGKISMAKWWRIKLIKHVLCIEEKGNAERFLVRTPERKRPNIVKTKT